MNRQHWFNMKKWSRREDRECGCNMRALLHIVSQHSLTRQTKSQYVVCLQSHTLCLLNLDFSCSWNAAKELHVLYTKIAGSYFNLWKLDGFSKTKHFIEHSMIKHSFWSDVTNHNIGWFLYAWNLIKGSELSFPRWQWQITNYSTDVWQAIDWTRIYSSLLRLITSSV